MHSEITATQQNTAVSTAHQIEFSEALLAAIKQQAEHPDPSCAPYLPRAVVAEARQAAEAMEHRYLAPLEAPALHAFIENLLDTLNACVRNPLDGDTLAIRARSCCLILADIPRRVFRDEFVTTCLKRCKFMPSPADFLEMAEEAAQTWREKTAQVKLIVTHDAGKRFTLGYAPPPEDDATEALRLTSEQSDQLQRQLDDTLGRFRSKREATAG